MTNIGEMYNSSSGDSYEDENCKFVNETDISDVICIVGNQALKFPMSKDFH